MAWILKANKKAASSLAKTYKEATRLFPSEIRGFPSSPCGEFGFNLNSSLLPELS